VIDSQDVTIIQTYIEQTELNLDTIVFEGVTDEEKKTIDDLKTYISELPQAQKLQAMTYIQRMQENWNDDTEKTRVIIDFETYLIDNNVEKADDMFNLLESLLVVGQQDTSEKGIAFQALKNLIPQTIVCDTTEEYATCSAMLEDKLQKIYESNDQEANKALGTQILDVIGNSQDMTTSQKLDFKAILKSFVYGGVSNIPEDEKQQVIDETPTQGGSSGLIGILVTITYWIAIFILIFGVIIGLYYVYYRLTNKDENTGFQDFIIDKTSFKKAERQAENTKEKVKDALATDILSSSNTVQTQAPKQEADPLGANTLEENTAPPSQDEAKSEDTSSSDENVPDWLAGNFSSSEENVPSPEPASEPEISQDEIAPQTPSEQQTQVASDTPPVDDSPTDEQIEQETQIDDSSVPDWLKQDF